MDAAYSEFDNQNQLIKVKDLFEKFVSVANNINALHKSHNLENVQSLAKTHEFDVLLDTNGPTGNGNNEDSSIRCVKPNRVQHSERPGDSAQSSTVLINTTPRIGHLQNSIVFASKIDTIHSNTLSDSAQNSIVAINKTPTADGPPYAQVLSNEINAVNSKVSSDSAKNFIDPINTTPPFDGVQDLITLPNAAAYSERPGDSAQTSAVLINATPRIDRLQNSIVFASEIDAIHSNRLSDSAQNSIVAINKTPTADGPPYAQVLSNKINAVNSKVSSDSAKNFIDPINATTPFDSVQDLITSPNAAAYSERPGDSANNSSTCSDVHIDVDMESAPENISIETNFPQLMEITENLNWDNLQKYTFGTETIYTNGEFTYEPAMDALIWDNENVIFSTEIDLPKNHFDGEMMIEKNVPNDQSHISTEPFYKNFMFGYEDGDDKPFDQNSDRNQNNVNLSANNNDSFQTSPTDLYMNLNASLRSCDNRDMDLGTSSDKAKRLFCTYCKKHFVKLGRHLTKNHKNEVEIKRLEHFPKGSKQRLTVLARLRKKGTFEHNNNPKINKGFMITSRRPNINRPRSSKNEITCANCLGSYSKSSIRNHFKTCTENVFIGERSVLVLGRMVEGRIHELACDTLRMDIFPYMTEDDIVRMIRFDWLIIIYGNKLCDRHVEVFQNDVISQKLRRAGRLLSEVKNIQPEVTDFVSMFKPKFYDYVIQAIRKVGVFDPVTKYYGSPSTAAAVVTEIRAVGQVLVAEFIKRDDAENQTKTENFMKLFNSDVGTAILKAVYRTMAKNKREKVEQLPTTEDVKLLASYVDRQRIQCFDALSREFTYKSWLQLAEYTMASLIIFNRRRIGETQNILVRNFGLRERLNKQMLNMLSAEDQQLANKYSRMKIRGKLDRTVPVLLKPHVEKCIGLLISHREGAKIPAGNEFLFALPTYGGKKLRRIDACALLRKLSLLCGAKHPETLRGTKMRKHVATMCVELELSEIAVSEVADFMGHHEKIHRQYYRQMPIVREIVKMSKILQAAQGAYDEEAEDEEEDEMHDGDNERNQGEPIAITENCSAEAHGHVVGEPIGDIDEGVRVQDRNSYEEVEYVQEDECVQVEAREEKQKISKKRWSTKEKAAVHKAFTAYFEERKLPSMNVILEQKKLHSDLKDRSQQQIKAWINNQFKKN